MALLTYLLLLLLGSHLLLTSATSERCDFSDKCPKCPAGQFFRDCKCKDCPAGTFMQKSNCDTKCHRCFDDCHSDLGLKVIENCTKTSDLRCECKEGYNCTKRSQYNGKNCKECEPIRLKIQRHATTDPPLGQSSTRPQPCSGPNCSRAPGNGTQPRDDASRKRLIAIVCPLVVVGGLVLVFLFCLGCPGHGSRFKQMVKKFCTVNANHPALETTQNLLTVTTGNMGPVHVHNPGTVIFSLGEFSGQIGQTKEEETEVKKPSEEDASCTVCQPMPSPTLPLSEEEHLRDHVFFPAQEQGKDVRMSMEEQL